MDLNAWTRVAETEWHVPRTGKMRVPAVLFATADLVAEMDDKVYAQMVNVAALPGIVGASYAMPDAHWGYGFPIGGVAAFDPEQGGVISAGGGGVDISCGGRAPPTRLVEADLPPITQRLADALYRTVPAGVGSTGRLRLKDAEMNAMLADGARWAVELGYGTREDLDHTEGGGRMEGAEPDEVSQYAKNRQRDEMGTLGSGNHYLEVQHVVEILDEGIAAAFGIH